MSSGKEFVSSSSTQSSISSCNGSSIHDRYEAVASSTEHEFAECSLSCSNMHMTDLEHMSFSHRDPLVSFAGWAGGHIQTS